MHLFFPYWLSSLGNASKEHIDCSLEKSKKKVYKERWKSLHVKKKKERQRFKEMMILFLLIQKKNQDSGYQ